MELFQILNSHGYPASTHSNPSALLLGDENVQDYISYLKDDCDNEDELTVVLITNISQIK